MKQYLLILILFILNSCGTKSVSKYKVDEDISIHTLIDTIDYNYATYFVVVADTNLSYKLLHSKMLQLNKQLNIPYRYSGSVL